MTRARRLPAPITLLRMLSILLAMLWQAQALPTDRLPTEAVAVTASERVFAGDIKAAARVVPAEMRARHAAKDAAAGADAAFPPAPVTIAALLYRPDAPDAAEAAAVVPRRRPFLARAPPASA